MADCSTNGDLLRCGEGVGCGIICESDPKGGGGDTQATPGGKCWWICDDGRSGEDEGKIIGEDVRLVRSPLTKDPRLEASTEVKVCMQNLGLDKAAILVDKILPYECYAPVPRLGVKVRLSMSGTLSEVLNRLGIHYEHIEDG